MLTFEKLVRKPGFFRGLAGLSQSDFEALYGVVWERYPDCERRRLKRLDRKRAIGGGRSFKHDLRTRLLMLLVYYRLYITTTLASFLFELDVSNVWRNIRYLEAAVKDAVPTPKKLYKKARRIRTLDELKEAYPDLAAFIDATEQEIPRPKNKRRRKSHYSGKKKRHTVKTQIMVNKKGVILHQTPYARGRRHDYDVFKDCHPAVPPEVEVGMDLGYQGVAEDFPGLTTKLPLKKKRGQERTRAEKQHNKRLARQRVVVEHAIRKIKQFKILAGTFRNHLTHYNTTFTIACGLVNHTLLATA